MKLRLSKTEWLLVGLIAIIFVAHLLVIANPFRSFVFDEAHYVPAARCLLNGTVCNVEHPPLAKASIAAGIVLFGDHGIGWRLPIVIFGTLALIPVYLIGRKLRDEKTGLLAAFFLGFENLWFIHSSIAMLDIIAFSLVFTAIALFFYDKKILSGVVLGLAMLAKEIAILVFIPLAVYLLYQQKKLFSLNSLKKTTVIMIKITIPAILIFMVGLHIYDVSYDAFPSSFHHVTRMFIHNQAIATPPLSDAVHPLQWFSGFRPAPYFVTSITTEDNHQRVLMQYLGQPNLVILLFIWIAIPLGWSSLREKKHLESLAIIFICIIFALFFVLGFLRITYPFYMLLIIPGICLLNAAVISRLPRNVIIMYCLGVLLWFFVWFPQNPLALGR